jgi:hypothetical protein
MATKQKYTKIIGLAIIIVILVVAIVITSRQNNGGGKNLSMDEAKTYAADFINGYLLSGETAEISEVSKYNSGLYLIKVKLEGVDDPIDSYLTKDGKIFFPQAIDVAEMKGQTDTTGTDAAATDDTKAAAAPEVPKNDKPVVELFVMSHCPYGTQIEKGILPVADTLKDKIDFKIKFVDYAMHGEKEVKEELSQYCINKEQAPKYYTYLKCFLEAGDSAGCLAKTGIDTKKNDACIAAADKQFKVMELFADQSTWQGGSYPQFNIYKDDNTKYSVGGSPTLIINGKEAQTGRDSASLLAAVCGAFNTAPAECATKLSSASPAPGFGTATTTDTNAAACATN